MKMYVTVNDRQKLPELNELIAAMWEENVSFSKAGDAFRFSDYTTLALCWDKWVDDPRWSNHHKYKEYIYFELPVKLGCSAPITIEMADDAAFVDKRAFLKAAYFLAKKAGGTISFDKKLWVTPDDFMNAHQDILNLSFQEAIEASLVE